MKMSPLVAGCGSGATTVTQWNLNDGSGSCDSWNLVVGQYINGANDEIGGGDQVMMWFNSDDGLTQGSVGGYFTLGDGSNNVDTFLDDQGARSPNAIVFSATGDNVYIVCDTSQGGPSLAYPFQTGNAYVSLDPAIIMLSGTSAYAGNVGVSAYGGGSIEFQSVTNFAYPTTSDPQVTATLGVAYFQNPPSGGVGNFNFAFSGSFFLGKSGSSVTLDTSDLSAFSFNSNSTVTGFLDLITGGDNEFYSPDTASTFTLAGLTVSDSSSLIFENLTVKVGISQISSLGELSLKGANLSFQESCTVSCPVTLDTGDAGSDTIFTLPSGTTATISGAIGEYPTGMSLRVQGSGTLALTSSGNAYGGGTYVYGGTLSFTNINQIHAGGVIELSNGTTLKALLTSPQTVSSPIGLSGTTTLDVSSSLTTTGVLSGSGTFTVNNSTSGQTGSLILDGASGTFAGDINIEGGSLTLQNATAIGSAVNLTTISGATFDISSHTVTVGNFSNNPSFPSNLGGTINIGSGSLTVNTTSVNTSSAAILGSGTLTAQGTSVWTLNGSFTGFTGHLIVDASGATLSSVGTTTLSSIANSGPLTLSGSTNITTPSFSSSGTLNLAGATLGLSSSTTINGTTNIQSGGGTLHVTSGTTTIAGVFTGVSGLALTVSGAGTVALSPSSTTFQGNFSVVGGTLSLTSGTSLATITTGNSFIVLPTGSSNTVNITSSITSNYGFQTYNGAVNVSGGNTAIFTGESIGSNTAIFNSIGTGTLKILPSSGSSYAGTVNVNAGTLVGNMLWLSQSAITVASGASLELNQVVTGTFKGTFAGAGTVEISGTPALTVTGLITAFTGSLILDAGSSATFTNAGSASITSLANNGALTLGSGTSIITSAYSDSGSGSLSFLGGTLGLATTTSISTPISAGSSGGTFSVASGTTTTLSGALTGSSGTKISLIGGGTLVLPTSGSLFQGDFGITAGTLKINNSASLATISSGSSHIILSGGTASILDIEASLSSNYGLQTYNGTVFVNTGLTAAFTGASSGSNSSFFTKTGTGTLSILPSSQGSSSYAGNVTVSAGTLIGNTVWLSQSAISIASTGTLEFDQTSNGSYSGLLSGSGDLAITGTSNLNFTNSLAGFTGDLILNASSLLSLSNSTTATLSSISNAGTLTLSSGSTINTPSFSGPGTLSFTGGTLGLSGATTLSNPITIGNGGGTLNVATTASITGALSGSNGQSLGLTGGGTLTLSPSSNLFSGNYLISNGILSINSSGNLATLSGSSKAYINLSGGASSTLAIDGNISSNYGFQTYNGTVNVASGLTASFTGVSAAVTGTTFTVNNGAGATLSIVPSSSSTGSNSTPAFVSTMIVNGGTVEGNTFWLSGSSVTLNGAALVFAQNANGTFQGSISDGASAGSVIIAGDSSHTLTFGAASSYTGGTTLTSGTLAMGGDFIGHTSSLLTGNGGILETTATFSTSRPVTLAATSTFSPDSSTSFTINSGITGSGGLIMDGKGTLILTGICTYTGGTTVESGTLTVNGSIEGSPVVDRGALLNGTGTINGGTTEISGSTAGGNSIGTLTFNGNLHMRSGSLFLVEVSPTEASKLVVIGDLLIDPEATVTAFLEGGPYINPSTHPILEVDGNITGRFEHLRTIPGVYMDAALVYEGLHMINLVLTPLTVHASAVGSNAIAVGMAIHEAVTFNRNVTWSLSSDGPVASSPILTPQVIDSLLPFVGSTEETSYALNQMHPASFKGMSIIQQNNAVEVRQALSYRMQNELDTQSCYPISKESKEEKSCNKEKKPFQAWVAGLGDVLWQDSNNHHSNPLNGYQSKLAGVVLGLDGNFAKYFYAGALGGYTSSHAHWRNNQGSGDINTGYAGLYFSAISKMFYGNISTTIGWNDYNAHRNIIYPGVNLTASNRHMGYQLLSHLDTGINLGFNGFTIRPFDSFDYVAQNEHDYTEKGAGEWNLHVNKSHSILLRNELGLQLAGCLCLHSSKWTISPKLSWVREVRVKGESYTAQFKDAGYSFTVDGYCPDRSMISPGVVVSGKLLDDRLSVGLYYNGEFTHGYSLNSYGGEARFGF